KARWRQQRQTSFRQGRASASSGVWSRPSAGTASGQPAAGNPATLKGENQCPATASSKRQRKTSPPETMGGGTAAAQTTSWRTTARHHGQGRRCCQEHGCTTRPSYGQAHSKNAQFCSQHKPQGMVDVVKKRCGHPGCTKRPSYGKDGSKKAEFCAQHAQQGMVDVVNKRCGHPGCTKRRSYGKDGGKKHEFCSQHALQGMANVVSRRCHHPGCTKAPSYGNDGSEKAEFCVQHGKPGMTNAMKRTCGHPGCTKRPSYGKVGSKKPEFCAQHVQQDMVNVRHKRCSNPGCTKRPSYGEDGSKNAEFCVQHARQGMVNVVRKRCGHPSCMKLSSYGKADSKKAEFFLPAARATGHGRCCEQEVRPSRLHEAAVVWKKRQQDGEVLCIAARVFSYRSGGTETRLPVKSQPARVHLLQMAASWLAFHQQAAPRLDRSCLSMEWEHRCPPVTNMLLARKRRRGCHPASGIAVKGDLIGPLSAVFLDDIPPCHYTPQGAFSEQSLPKLRALTSMLGHFVATRLHRSRPRQPSPQGGQGRRC
ncbi:unnamed protein product, partial [Ectocarpus sp. 12 AP-2014]